MPTRIPCPVCETAFTYSPALRGRTVRCWQCEHAFTVEAPETVGAAARVLVPPPLPDRDRSHRDARLESASRDVKDRERAEAAEDRTHHRRADHDRPTGTGTLIGLLAVSFLGFLVVVAGVTFMVWPNPSKTTGLAADGPPPPVLAPVAVEPQKNLRDILNDVPARAPAEPGRPKGPR